VNLPAKLGEISGTLIALSNKVDDIISNGTEVAGLTRAFEQEIRAEMVQVGKDVAALTATVKGMENSIASINETATAAGESAQQGVLDTMKLRSFVYAAIGVNGVSLFAALLLPPEISRSIIERALAFLHL
jgi:uncharacterized protein YlxW (UPF0749 family)